VIRRISYDHPVYTKEGVAAQARHAEISGPARRTHYCGAYWGWGFHEDGVVSAIRACERVEAADVPELLAA
jgi:predicted NAD/FAD-binding protein